MFCLRCVPYRSSQPFARIAITGIGFAWWPSSGSIATMGCASQYVTCFLANDIVSILGDIAAWVLSHLGINAPGRAVHRIHVYVNFNASMPTPLQAVCVCVVLLT